MTTQYTTILKLALPVEGELSGTWGDVVNDNITQMVEQAVAGKAVVNTWTGNSHTLTTADGTTSESRCAILELTDTGTALTGAGTVVCPTNTKLYIVDNNTARIITVKTSGGTGVAVPVGKTMLVYCDGTNVVEGVTHANSLSLGTSTSTVNAISTATDLGAGGSSDSNLPTQLAVKTYVDGQIAATNELSEVLTAGNVTGANDIDVENAQKVQFRDAAIYLNSSADGQLDIVADGEVQIATALVDINGNLDVSGTTNISGSVSFTKNAIASVAISGVARSSNTVTVTTSAVHGLTSGDLVNVNGVADTSFNGYFTASVSSTTVFTYSQTAADASSSGGSTTEIVYNLNASGTALNQMNGPLNITANSPIDGLEITQSGAGNGLHVTGTTGLVGNVDVTGTVTADGLTVDGNNSYTSNIKFDYGASAPTYFANWGYKASSDGNKVFLTITDGGAAKDVLVANYNGDVGIGTDSPAAKVNIDTAEVGDSGTSSSTRNLLLAQTSSTQATAGTLKIDGIIHPSVYRINIDSSTGSGAAAPLSFSTANGATETMRIDAAGNVGIGVVPDTWSLAGEGIIDLGTFGSVNSSSTLGTTLSFNAYYNSGWKAKNTTGAILYLQDSASHQWFTSGAVTADATITDFSAPKMKLDASGNLLVGGTDAAFVGTKLVTGSYSDTSAGLSILTSSSSGTGYLLFGDGTGTGGYSGQINYAHATNRMGFNTNNAERMAINSSGNVGIGMAPDANNVLSVKNTSGKVINVTNGTSADLYVDLTAGVSLISPSTGILAFGTANTERMRIDSSGRVGIGGVPNTNWRNDLANQEVLMLGTEATLFSDGGVTTELWNNAYINNTDTIFNISTRGASRYQQYQGVHKWFTAASASAGTNINTELGTTPKMTLDASGKVGIGRTDPSQLLEVHKSTGGDQTVAKFSAHNYGDTGKTYIEIGTEHGDGSSRIGSLNTSGNKSALVFEVHSNTSGSFSEAMRLDDAGNLLVGTTTTPSLAGLSVGSTGLGKNINVFSSANGNNGLINVFQSNGTLEGQLYAGTGDVNLYAPSTVKIVASSAGVKLTSGSSSWVANSDERAKDIIEPISNAVQKVSTLRAVIGKYKTDTEETRRSFLIAQDVQAVLPEAVDATDEDNLGVRYTETIPLLVAAMKEQQATIEALTARITALES